MLNMQKSKTIDRGQRVNFLGFSIGQYFLFAFVFIHLGGCGDSDESQAQKEAVLNTISAGADQTVEQRELVTLSSVVNNIDIAGIEWEQISGSSVVFSDIYSIEATFQAPDVDTEETLEFRLTVFSIDGSTYIDHVSIVVTLNPRFVKIAMNGSELTGVASDWACVKDTETGRYWEKKSLSIDPNYHYIQDRFSWYSDGVGYQYGSSSVYERCTTSLFGLCNTEQATMLINNTGLCGFSDWRLPTVSEFRSLGTPDEDYYNYFSWDSYYWTSEQYNSEMSVAFTFYDTTNTRNYNHYFPWYIMLVR